MVDYKKIVNDAGYSEKRGDYIARKLKEKSVPKNQLNNLPMFFRRSVVIAGVDLMELGDKLQAAADKTLVKKLNLKPKKNLGEDK